MMEQVCVELEENEVEHIGRDCLQFFCAERMGCGGLGKKSPWQYCQVEVWPAEAESHTHAALTILRDKSMAPRNQRQKTGWWDFPGLVMGWGCVQRKMGGR